MAKKSTSEIDKSSTTHKRANTAKQKPSAQKSKAEVGRKKKEEAKKLEEEARAIKERNISLMREQSERSEAERTRKRKTSAPAEPAKKRQRIVESSEVEGERESSPQSDREDERQADDSDEGLLCLDEEGDEKDDMMGLQDHNSYGHDGEEIEKRLFVQEDEMILEEEETKTKVTKGNTRRSSSTSTSARSCPSKVKKSEFDDRIFFFVKAAHSRVRIHIATKHAFPKDEKEFIWERFGEVVELEPSQPIYQEILQEIQSDASLGAMAQKYTWAGVAQLRGELKTKAKVSLCIYGIPGGLGQEEVSRRVKWLLKGSRFKYGGLNYAEGKGYAFDEQMPYGHPLYSHLILKQWFGSGKGEGIRSAADFRDIPLPLLALITTVIEQALMEFESGQFVAIAFTMEAAKIRYEVHLDALKALEDRCPTWMAQMRKKLYDQIITSGKLKHLLAEDEKGDCLKELEDVDFEALERSAGVD